MTAPAAKKKIPKAKATPSPIKPLLTKTGKPSRAAKSIANRELHAKILQDIAKEKSPHPRRKVGAIAAGKKDPANPLMIGGKSWNREKVMEVVCSRLATSNHSLVRILRSEYEGFPLPDSTTIHDWLRTDDNYALAYERAKTAQAQFLVEEIIEIADDSSGDVELRVNSRTGEEYVTQNSEFATRSRLRVDTRKWLAEKLLPKIYGPALSLKGDPDYPLRTQSTVLDPIALAKMPEVARLKLLESLK